MAMKITFIGCERVQGIKKDNGKPYGPFYQVHYLAPLQEVNNENRQVSGVGFTPKVINVEEHVYSQFLECKALSQVDVELGADPNNINRTIVTGVVK